MNKERRRRIRKFKRAVRATDHAWAVRDPGSYQRAMLERVTASHAEVLRPTHPHELGRWELGISHRHPLTHCPHIEGDPCGWYTVRGFMDYTSRHLSCGQFQCSMAGALTYMGTPADFSCDRCGKEVDQPSRDLTLTTIVIGFVNVVAFLCSTCEHAVAPDARPVNR